MLVQLAAKKHYSSSTHSVLVQLAAKKHYSSSTRSVLVL